MNAVSHVPAPAGADRASLVPSPAAEIATRKRLANTKLGESRGIIKVKDRAEPSPRRTSIVTRRQVMLRERRRKKVLMALAILLGLFPPMWVVYFVAWLVWRNRPAQRSMSRVRKGIRALEKDQTGVALKQLQDAHFLDPANSDALYWLGLLLSRQGRHDEAAEALSIVADRVPGLPEVETALAEAYVAMGEPESAVYHAQRLFDAAPHAPESLLTLADAFEAAGRTDLAVETLEQAPLHKRTLSDALVQIHYRLGALYQQRGDPDRALHHFKRVYARDITYADVRTRVETLEAAGEAG